MVGVGPVRTRVTAVRYFLSRFTRFVLLSHEPVDGFVSPNSHITMTSRIYADLQRLDAALKSCPNRATLKNCAQDSWKASSQVIPEVFSIYGASVFSDPSGAAAQWMHWRKSSASKQLLGFLKAVIEVLEADAQRVAPALPFVVRVFMDATLHGCISMLSFLFTSTQSAALWPAMREWIVDQGGIRSMWTALARTMVLARRERAAACKADSLLSEQEYDSLSYQTLRRAFPEALSLTNQQPFAASACWPDEIAHIPGLITSLSILFSDVLPRDLAAGNAHKWDISSVLRQINGLQLRSRYVLC